MGLEFGEGWPDRAILAPSVAARIAALTVADEGASIAAVEGIDSRGQADHARDRSSGACHGSVSCSGIRRPKPIE